MKGKLAAGWKWTEHPSGGEVCVLYEAVFGFPMHVRLKTSSVRDEGIYLQI
jgi:hypothetical protein